MQEPRLDWIKYVYSVYLQTPKRIADRKKSDNYHAQLQNKMLVISKKFSTPCRILLRVATYTLIVGLCRKSKFVKLIFLLALFVVGMMNTNLSAELAEPSLEKVSEYNAINTSTIKIAGDLAVIISWIEAENGDQSLDIGHATDISLIDISDPLNMTLMSTIQRQANDIAIFGDYLYVHDYESNLTTYNITDPLNPVELHSEFFGGALSLEIYDGYLFSIGHPDIVAYSLTDPISPTYLDRLLQDLNGVGYLGVAIDKKDELIAVASSEEGFHLSSFDGKEITLRSTIPVTAAFDYATGVSFIPNSNLLVASSNQQTTVFDIANMSAPILVHEDEDGSFFDTKVTESGFWKSATSSFNFYQFGGVRSLSLSISTTISKSGGSQGQWDLYEKDNYIFAMGQGISVYEKQNWELLTDGVASTTIIDTSESIEISFRTFTSSKRVGSGGFVVPGISFGLTVSVILILIVFRKGGKKSEYFD
ncbi:MAG: hypothetical protein IH840_10110 [Candidatus Heimdallarchaeota archaeon]|nr:hypothetical protein [Candidatus Heimdallarchaeota archaeon]